MDGEQPFSVATTGAGSDHPVVVVHGELDLATAPQLAEHLDAVLTRHPGKVVIDLADTTFMDCSAVRIIETARRKAPGGVHVVLRNPRRVVKRLLSLLVLDGCYVIEDEAASPHDGMPNTPA